MKTYVHPANNGWPGLFIPGDEALGEAYHMEMLANSMELGQLPKGTVELFLRRMAMAFRTCRGQQGPEVEAIDRYSPQ